jgi:hypothetical protein
MSIDSNTTDAPAGRGQFVARTFLYIRKYGGDIGSEPLPAGIPEWASADVQVKKPDGSLGCEAVAEEWNEVQVTISNDGGVDARDVFVEVFIADPSTAFTPAVATPVGSGYVTVPGYSRLTARFPWLPSGAQAGHRCLAARVCLFHPADSYRDRGNFNSRGDRHVAQRNIHIVPAPAVGGAEIVFPFKVGNPGSTRLATRVLAREVRSPAQREALRGALGSSSAQFAERPLGALALDAGEAPRERVDAPGAQRLLAATPPLALPPPPGRPTGLVAAVRELVALLMRLLGARGQEKAPPTSPALSLVLEPGEAAPAMLRVPSPPAARPGELHAIDVVQYDERERVIGGLTVLIRH